MVCTVFLIFEESISFMKIAMMMGTGKPNTVFSTEMRSVLPNLIQNSVPSPKKSSLKCLKISSVPSVDAHGLPHMPFHGFQSLKASCNPSMG